MFGGERSMYWIKYKRFSCLGSYSRPHIIGIKACWFGFEDSHGISFTEKFISILWNFFLKEGGNKNKRSEQKRHKFLVDIPAFLFAHVPSAERAEIRTSRYTNANASSVTKKVVTYFKRHPKPQTSF